MKRPHPLFARLLALLLLLAAAAVARADTPIALWKAFDGRVNFTGTQVTLRTQANSTNNGKTSSACTVTAPGTLRSASLALPAGATVVSARLYWAGSGTPDSTVTFEGKDVSASTKFTSGTVGNGFNYFGGVADVTAVVKAKGTGTYNFSGLTVANGAPWCDSQGVLGGFSLLVVYSHPDQPERVLNVYEGFRYVQNSEVVVNANNFRWDRKSYSVKEKARVGHISWEGDPTLAQDGERLLFEDEEVSDALNPEGNQFNSRSNINNDKASHGIDFDAYDTSVTIWSGYDATVTTRYRTGQDMVLLNAEILVVPTLPVADLAIAIRRAGALKLGTDVEYTVTVTNNGPYTESGTITVTNKLPAGMYYVSGTVTGWTCSASYTEGTCTYKGGLAPGASAPVLTVRARVATVGEKTNTVTVKGTATDDNLDNNSASDTGTATAVDGSSSSPTTASRYVFTDAVCTAGYAVGTAGAKCKTYALNTVGGKPGPVYITATDDKGLVASPSSKQSTTVPMQFMLECINPAAGTVGARLTDAVLHKCAEQGQPAKWSDPVDVRFAENAVSVTVVFTYNDIGKIRLNLKTGVAIASTAVFVSAPEQIAFKRISYAGQSNPGNKTGDSAGFAPAGAPVTLEIGALLYGTAGYAPNFGNENPRPVIMLDRSTLVTLPDQGNLQEAGTRSWAGGIMTSQASWSEVGATNFVAWLSDPDLSGDATKDNLYFDVAVAGHTVPVGRFYPAYFKTDVSGPFNCPANLPEAVGCPRPTSGAVYAQQPFNITVDAYNAANERVKNFTGAWFRPITLSAASAAGGPALALNLTPPANASKVTIAGTTAVLDPATGTSADKMLATASYKLAVGYRNSAPRALDITNPTTVFVRAVASENTVAGNIDISSLRSDEVSDEGSILVLNGRLTVPNALGTDLLRTPLALRAEYWAGAAQGWLLNPDYADALGASGTRTTFVSCSPAFATAGTTTCDTAVVAASTAKMVTLAKGAGVLWLNAPGKRANGAARAGSILLQYDGWPWLPSARGRVSFGSHRSPVIYVREMYF